MKNIRRVSVETAKKKALPILLSGFAKRNKIRSTAEDAQRSPEKVIRDGYAQKKPYISPI